MSEQDYSLLSSISHYCMLWQDGVNYDDFIYDLRALAIRVRALIVNALIFS